MTVPFVRHILRNAPASNDALRPTRERGPKRKPAPKRKGLIGNPDLAVLKAENQNPTRVTPRIAKLAQGLFREELMVVGGAPPPVNKAEEETDRKKMFVRLRRLISRTLKDKKKINYTKDDRISVMADLYTAVDIEGTTYRVRLSFVYRQSCICSALHLDISDRRRCYRSRREPSQRHRR
jgi:DNA (cytosine-5)-methyltransferase 1